jgi:D-inositol-3-phosphate glycosyltransferase
VWEISRHLAARGHDVTIVGGAGAISRAVPGVRVARFPFVDRMTWRDLKPLRRHIELTKLLERVSLMPAAVPTTVARKPDIVHLHKPYDFMIGPLMHAAGAKVIYHGHGEDFYPFDQPLSHTVDAMLSCSGYNAETLQARYGTQPEVVFNGFDRQLFTPQKPDPAWRSRFLHPDERGLLITARLQPWKGIQYAIEALRMLVPERNLRLLIAGEGTYRRRLEQQVKGMGLRDHVSFLGNVPHADMPRLYAIADVVLGTSFASETFGMALCEALACERPVIATDWAGYREVVLHEQTGLIVPAQHPPAFAIAIARLLGDPDLASQLAHNGRERVEQLFTWEAVTDRVEAAYQRLINHE